MSHLDDIRRFLSAQGHGELQRGQRLKGSLPLPGGTELEAWLAQTGEGVFLAAAVDTALGTLVDLSRVEELRYQARLLGDRLVVGSRTFSVPYGRSAEVRRILRTGRVLAGGTSPRPGSAPSGPFIQALAEHEAAWVATRLEADEVLLAWLLTATETDFLNPVQDGLTAPWRLVLTDRRALLVALSDLGDVREQPLAEVPMRLSEGTGRVDLKVGSYSFSSPLGRDRAFRVLTELTGLPREPRLREAARLSRLTRTPEGWAAAGRFLQALGEAAGPVDELALALLTEDPEPLEAAMARLRAEAPDSAPAAELVERWELEEHEALRLLEAALDGSQGPEEAAWALPLHEAVRPLRLAAARDLFAETEADLALAEHLLFAGAHDRAQALLEPRLQALPDEDLVEVLPAPGADLTRGHGGQPVHIRVLELLVQARGGPEQADTAALAALARHQPLVAERQRELATHSSGRVAARAARALALLEGASGPQEASLPAPPPVAGALSAEELEALRHPVEREGGALGRLQGALAKVVPPDLGEVRSYCQRAEAEAWPALHEALGAACTALGMDPVPAWISHGEKRVGVRSYEKPDPFVLVGAAHLEEGGPHALSPAELRFVLGVELMHLRLGHSRVTSEEVWAGVWSKGFAAVSTTASLLPFLGYLPVDLIGRGRTARAVQRVVPSRWLQRVYGAEAEVLEAVIPGDLGRLGEAGASALGSVTGTVDKAGKVRAGVSRLRGAAGPEALEADLGADTARLVAAHRVMQITADRAGLLLAGDVHAAVSALLKTNSRLTPEVPRVQAEGLCAVLGRRDDEDRPVYPHLSVRLAALLAFWLSEEQARLHDALVGGLASGDEE